MELKNYYTIAQSVERNLQIAIDNNVPRRISFYENMRNKIQIAINRINLKISKKKNKQCYVRPYKDIWSD